MMPWWSRTLLALMMFACGTAAAAVDEDDLLPVDEAFALSARAVAPDRIEVDWKIAEGYYLYRHRISAHVVDAAERADAIDLPHGDPHTDEFFGKVETFRKSLTGTLANVVARDGQLAIKVKYQGCADLGICYPPQARTLTVTLPVAAAPSANPAAAPASPGSMLSIGQSSGVPLIGGAPAGVDALPLPPERAFGFEAIARDGNTLLLRFTPARGYYLYRDRSRFRLHGAKGISALRPQWPKGVSHRDEHFGDVIVYFDQVDVPLPLARTSPDAAKAELEATFQGCQTDGICYPPMTRRVSLSIPAGKVASEVAAPDTAPTPTNGSLAGASSTEADVGATAVATPGLAEDNAVATVAAPTTKANPAQESSPAATGRPQAEDSRLAAALSGSHRWLALLGFFGAGLLLAFTPCVLPMIPILSGLIAGRGERIGAMRAFWLSLVYVLASAVVFTIAGVVAGLVGANLQAAFQTPWILVLFALLFVALSLSMFGLYELQLPAALRSRLGTMSDHQRGGSWLGVAAMGALSALIVGPCVAPPLAAAVLYIGQTRDPVFGGAALFLLAMGMGTPLLAFGVAAGRGLPTSGPWMIAIQRVFGFVFIGLAIWMLSRILPAPATLALYGLLVLAMSAWVFGLARSRMDHGPGSRQTLLRFAGLVLGLVGAAELFGALGGGSDPLQPLAGLSASRAPRSELSFRTIKTVDDLDREIAAANAAGKPLLFDFYADWCVACKEMEKYTFTRPEVHAALADFVLLKADVTANDAADQALMKRSGVIGPPATLFYIHGAERRHLRLFGFEKADAFVQRIGRAK